MKIIYLFKDLELKCCEFFWEHVLISSLGLVAKNAFRNSAGILYLVVSSFYILFGILGFIVQLRKLKFQLDDLYIYVIRHLFILQ